MTNRLTTLTVDKDLTVNSGNTVINGENTVINTTEVDVKDNAIVLNKGARGVTSIPSGIILENKTDYTSLYNDGSLYFLKSNTLPDFKTLNPTTATKADIYCGNINGNLTISGLTADKILKSNSSGNIVSSSYGESDLVVNGTSQVINGSKTFMANLVTYNAITNRNPFTINNISSDLNRLLFYSAPVSNPASQTELFSLSSDGNNSFKRLTINTGGTSELYLRGNSESGFSIYTTNNADGLNFWSTAANSNILKLKNVLNPDRVLLTDSSNYVSSASFGSSDIVLTSGSQNIGGTKTFDQNIVASSGITTNSVESIGSTMNIGSNNTTQTINIGAGTGLQTVNIGSAGSGDTTINIGAAGDIVNVAGTLNYISTDNLEVKDTLITLNKASVGSGTARNSGINIRDNSVDNTGYITTSGTGNFFTLKAPENSFVLSTPVLTANSTTVTTTESQTIGGTKTFSSGVVINPTTNQLVLGTTNTTTITCPAPAASRTYTIPDAGAAANFVMTASNQTIAGTKSFSAGVAITPTTNQLVLGTTRTITLTAPTPATASRVYTIPDAGTNTNFVMTDSAQTINGIKTFTASPIINPGVGINGEIFIRGNNETGFSLYSVNNATGLQVWSTGLSTSILNLRNALTANRLLTTDASNYLASASIGVSDLVLTTGNQLVGGNKWFTSPIATGQSATQNFTYFRTNSFTNIPAISVATNFTITCVKQTLLNYCTAMFELRVCTSEQNVGNQYAIYRYFLSVDIKWCSDCNSY
ncbi:MAG: beta strand repeat-containing protein [Dolichospermum sp.]